MACAGTQLGSVQPPLTLNVADTDCAADIVTAHEPVPEQPAPLQPAKVEPAAGTAVSVTTLPRLKLPAQVAPQLMAAGDEVTVPEPLPPSPTLSVAMLTLKVAPTVCAPETVTVQEPVPEQTPPLQPAKLDPLAGTAANVRTVPVFTFTPHVATQLIKAGVEVTRPEPVPLMATVIEETVVVPR